MSDSITPIDPLAQPLQQVLALIQSGQLPKAAHALNALQKRAPMDPRIALVGLRLAQRTGHSDAALQAAQRALDLAPDWHVAQIEMALQLAERQHKNKAIALAIKALASEPHNPAVMAGAINVTRLCGDDAQMMAWAEDGVRRFPNDAGIRLFLAAQLQRLDRHEEAIQHYEYILERVPEHAPSLEGALHCALALKQTAQAQVYADRWLALDPKHAVAAYWHAIAHGQNPSHQPSELIQTRFDQIASDFDLHAVRALQYKVPERVAHILNELYPDKRFNLLDLGCGTGLLGVYIQHVMGSVAGHLIGVDLSEKMMQQAARHGIYSKFYRANVLDALRDTPAEHYEVITCNDVLVYIGDLSTVIPNAWHILKPRGYFIFTCETAEENEADFVLRSDIQRYSHKISAVEKACQEAGFDPVTINELESLRLEAGQPVKGFMVIAHKPAQQAQAKSKPSKKL